MAANNAWADVFHISGVPKEMVLNRDDCLGEVFARGLKSAASVACHWSVRLHPYSSIIIMAVWVVSLVSLSMPLQKKKRKKKKKKKDLCVSAACGCASPLICSRDLPQPRPARWPPNDALQLNEHPVASRTPAVYYGVRRGLITARGILREKLKTRPDVRREGMFARFLILSGVTENKDMHSMKRFIASRTPDTCKFLEKRTKQSQIKSATTCKWGGGKKNRAMEPIIKM